MRGGGNAPYLDKLSGDSKDSIESATNLKVDSIDSQYLRESNGESNKDSIDSPIDSIDSHDSLTNPKANQSIDSKDSHKSHLDSSLRATHYAQNDDRAVITFSTQKSIASYIKKFATLSGIKSLYPTLDEDFLSELLDDSINSIYDITQSNYEKINAELFNQIADAILNNEIVSFDYKDKQRIVKPYKLAHIKGIWYLIADENNKLKHFSFTKMQNIAFLPKRFYPKRAFLKQISDNQNLWLSANPKSALIIIDIKAKGYFLRKSLPKNINLIGYDDKKILIRYSFAFDDEIFNFLKIWLPYARIKEPKALQIRFNEILENYVREMREKLKVGLDLANESKGDSGES